MRAPFDGSVSRREIVARIEAHPLGDEPEAMRENFAGLVRGGAGVARRDDGAAGPLIVHFHGGGYVFGSPETHARLGTHLAAAAGGRVILPRYPLAPERPWPAALEAARDAVEAAWSDGRPLLLSGDSAGGHLALVTALELARRGTRVAGLVLFSPNTDRTGLSRTRERNDPLDPMVDDEGDRRLARLAFGDMPDDHPHVSPALDDLSLLPPLYIEAGAEEVLLGDSLVLAERARAAGVDTVLHVEPHGLHMGQLWAPWWDVAVASLARAGAFARARVAAPGATT